MNIVKFILNYSGIVKTISEKNWKKETERELEKSYFGE